MGYARYSLTSAAVSSPLHCGRGMDVALSGAGSFALVALYAEEVGP